MLLDILFGVAQANRWRRQKRVDPWFLAFQTLSLETRIALSAIRLKHNLKSRQRAMQIYLSGPSRVKRLQEID